MSDPAPQAISVEEYLRTEEKSPYKREYVGGFVYPLHGQAGASRPDALIGGNIFGVLYGDAMRAGCRLYQSDMKLRAEGSTSFFYPDVMLVCDDGPDAYYKDKPCVIAEVLSPSTLRTDTNEKRYSYLELPSLQLYLLVDSRRRFVWGYYRGQTGWEERFFGEGETIPVPCADVALSAEDIYIQTPYI